MRSTHIRLGAVAAAISLLAACSNESTSPAAEANNGISARGGSSSGGGGGGGGGGGSTSGSLYRGIVDSTKIVNVGVYYPSYQDVWYSGSHAFRATTATKIHSSSDVPLQAGACAEFTYTAAGTAEYTSDIKVLSTDKCGGI